MASDGAAITNEHRTQLRHATPALIENMDPDPVIRNLYARGVLTAADQMAIKGNGRTKEEKIMMLIEKLILKNDRAFDIFIEALKKTEQGHVAEIILRVNVTADPSASTVFNAAAAESAGAMSEPHVDQLRAASEKVSENMNPDPVLTILYARGVFTMKEVNHIKANGRATRIEMADCIMTEVACKNDSAFEVLIDALRESEQGHLAKIIVDKGVAETENVLANLPDIPDDTPTKTKSREAVKELAP